MRRLRIVTPRFGAEVIGGAETIARQLGLELTARDWRVDAWTTTAVDERTWKAETAPGPSVDSGIEVLRFAPRMRRRPGVFRQATRVFNRLPRSLRAETPWVVAQGPYVPGLVRALSTADPVPTLFIPYLFYPTLWGLPAAPHPRILIPAAHDEPALHLRAVGRAIAATDAVWYSTPEERDLVTATHRVAATKPTAVGTVGVTPPTNLDPDGFRQRHGITGPTLYYGGRTAPGKGFDILTDAFATLRQRMPTAQLLLSGEAGESTSDEGVIALGRLDHAERWNAIAAATAVVVPSRFESLSLLALEAWAVGRPCLLNGASPVLAGQSSRSGGALLFETADQLADAAEHLLGDATMATRLGAAGQAYVAANYTWDAVVARLETLIDEATP